MNQRFKMLFLQKIFSYNFKDKIFIYSFFKFSVIYSILHVDVPVGMYVLLFAKKDILSIWIIIFLYPKVKNQV